MKLIFTLALYLVLLDANGATNSLPPLPTNQVATSIPTNTDTIKSLQQKANQLLAIIQNTNQLSIAWDAAGSNIGYRVSITDSNGLSMSNIFQTNGTTFTQLPPHKQFWYSVSELFSFVSSSGGSNSIVTNESPASHGSFMFPINQPILILANDNTVLLYLSSSTSPGAIWSSASVTNDYIRKELNGISNDVAFKTIPANDTNGIRLFKVK